MPTSTHPR
ncbi:unnamed protein product [Cuscuta epithymum]|uniref:Uncharacterized protein n=1 Tax=Cuscuta epithymum TaxID=186058 RepID=A0AAV0G7E3_9ASTE|nr:unnamed protein product [Cuscuta epithymum]